MNYELAKELKNAGFPQGTGRYFLESGEHAAGSAEEVEFMLSAFEAKDTNRHHFAYIPTLEELIEACGDELFRLERTAYGWLAQPYDINQKYGAGTTPTEAVARLRLALQKK